MSNNKINYPNDFFSFKGGEEISDDEINMCINQCIERLEADKEDDTYTYLSDGDIKVIVFRRIFNGEYFYEVNVCKNRLEYDFKVKK